MDKLLLLLVVFFLSFSSIAQTTEIDTIYSKSVKDKFIITIRKPAGFDLRKKYHHVYITDGSLGIGDYIFGKDKSWSATIPSSCIIIGISHIGDWETKRQRDFLPSITVSRDKDFGHAENFYSFLKDELIPVTEKKLPNKKDRVFIGHSFGGLFSLYTVFQKDKLFDRHFAISPSVWANDHALDSIENKFSKMYRSLNANVTIYVGGLEFLNKVLYSTRDFYDTVASRKYAGMDIRKIEIGNANHFSIRKPAVDRIFEMLKE